MLLSGEQRLALAILLQGLRDFATTDLPSSKSAIYPTRSEIIDARIWIAEKSDHVCSFHWCCEAIGIHPDKLRQQVMKLWRENPAALRAMIGQLGVNFAAQTDEGVIAGGHRKAGKYIALAGRTKRIRAAAIGRPTARKPESIPEQHGAAPGGRDKPHLPAAIRRQSARRF